MKSVAIYPDRSPVEIIYKDEGFHEIYQYKKVDGSLNNDEVQQFLLPINEKSKSPPKIVLEAIEQKDFLVHPESQINVK